MANVQENKETPKIEEIYTAATVVGAPTTDEKREVKPVAGSTPHAAAPFVPAQR